MCYSSQYKFSKIPPSTSLHSAVPVHNRVFFVSVDIHVSLRRQQHPKRGPAIRVAQATFFCKRRSSWKHRNRNLTVLSLKIQTAVSR